MLKMQKDYFHFRGNIATDKNNHFVKSVQIQSYFWSVFSRIRTEYGDTKYLSVFSPNAGKYGPEITPYLDTFQAVNILRKISLQFQNLKLSISCKIAFYIFFVIKCETFEVKRSIRQFWSNQNSLNKTVCFHCTKKRSFPLRFSSRNVTKSAVCAVFLYFMVTLIGK